MSKKQKPIFPQKGMAIFVLKDGLVISGKGTIEAVKLPGGDIRFNIIIMKNYGK